MLRVRAVPLFFSLILAFCATANSQNSEKSIKLKDLPEAVGKTVEQQRKGAILRGLAKEVEDGKTFYEAELKVNGHNKDVLIDPTGAVVEIEEQVTLASLPALVKATVQKAAGKGKILIVESITKNGALEAYEAHLSKAGRRSEIKVGLDGKLINTEKEQSR